MATIKTPDQRVRVFISSTINELAEERKTAREAIGNLRLIPVFFEAGARPHPPRDLYRAYLEQSHIFIGIYWNSYGWTAPDMEISGLEDEYRLSAGKPRLIYVKQPAPERQPKLSDLLHSIQTNDTASYQKFSTCEELKELLQNDLALLLSERFEAENPLNDPLSNKQVKNLLPVIRSTFIGREEEIHLLQLLLLKKETALVTITGAGGTGKTRLALHLANTIKAQFSNGVVYIPLAAIHDEKLLAAEMAHTIGLFDTGKQRIEETVIDFLRDKELLLLLDNFEQLINAGKFVAEIMEHCPAVKILVTSRTPLRIRGEQVFPLEPLLIHGTPANNLPFNIDASPAVQLFIQRAREVNPSLQLNEENIRAIVDICRKLDGLPLAIELAAAKTKFLSPVALAARMAKPLDLLSGGARDLPERQQTLRATIDWSYDLLDELCRHFFRHLSVFNDTWTFESAGAFFKLITRSAFNIVDLTEKLLDLGLIKVITDNKRRNGDPAFTMFQTVREYGIEMLQQQQEFDTARSNHLCYYLGFLQQENPHHSGVTAELSNESIDCEYQNINTAFNYAIEKADREAAWQIIGLMGRYWAAYGRFSEVFEWLKMAGLSPGQPAADATIPAAIQAKASLGAGLISFLSGKTSEAEKYLERSVVLFTTLNDEVNIGRAKTFMGLAMISNGRQAAGTLLQEALQIGEQQEDDDTILIAAAFLAEIYTAKGAFEQSQKLLTDAAVRSREMNNIAHLSNTMLQQAILFAAKEEYQQAVQAAEESIGSAENSWYKSVKGWSQLVKAQGLFMLDNIDEAATNFKTGVADGRNAGDKTMILYGITGLTAVAFARKEYNLAAQLLGSIENLAALYQVAFWSINRNLYEWLVAALQQQCTPEILKEAKAIGSIWSFEETISFALRIS